MTDRELREDLKQLRIVPGEDEEGDLTSRSEGRPPRRRWRRFFWLVLLGAIVVGAALSIPYEAFEQPEVQLVPVTRRDLGVPPVVLTAVGYIVPRRQIVVSSQTQGKIVEMPVGENQRVREGDLIARLENPAAEANLALAEAQLADAQRELELISALFERGVRARSELERVQKGFEIARARVDVARAAVQDTVLRAPFEGTIVRKLRDLGEFLTLGVTAEGDPGTAVVVLANLDQIEVELEINETEISKIRSGMAALVIPEALPERRYEGFVVEVSPEADRRKATVPVRVRIREPDADLLPEMTSKVRFLTREPPGPIRVMAAVPSTAVVEYDNRDVVWEVKDNRVQPVPVVLDPITEYMEQQAREPGGALDDGSAFAALAGGELPPPGVGSAGEQIQPTAVQYTALREGPPEGALVVENPPRGLDPGDLVRIAP